MVVLPYLSIIQFSGADAGSFLHNQVSADVLGLDTGDSTFACYCEPKGRVLALMLICRLDDSYYVIMSSALVQMVVERLKIYVMRSRVIIRIKDEVTLSGIEAKQENAPPLAVLPAIPLPGGARHLLVTTTETAPGIDIAAQDAWKIGELKQGISWLCPETSGQFLPQMLGFDQLGAVNFRKGCYPGQEIVARTHYLGKVKRHPRLLLTPAKICPDPLAKIQITSAGESFQANVTDCGHDENVTCLLVVTRMDPDLGADQIEYGGQLSPLL